MNEGTFEEKMSIRLSILNLVSILGAFSLLLIILTVVFLRIVPFGNSIAGGEPEINKQFYKLMLKTDSLEQDIRTKDNYINNIREVILGMDPIETVDGDTIKVSVKKEIQDSLLSEIDNISNNNLLKEQDKEEGFSSTPISNFFFFTPVKGIVTNAFNAISRHYGIDVAGKKTDAVKATLDGTVVFASWTLETGNVIGIQHHSNIFTVYKHNSALLKRQGDYVKAGDPIAFIGNSGELSTGPHMHFELWYNGSAINPTDYMVF